MSRYSLDIRWSDDDACYIAILPEFGNALTHGATYERAARMGRDLIESFVEWYAQDGIPLPLPHLFDFDAVRGEVTNEPSIVQRMGRMRRDVAI